MSEAGFELFEDYQENEREIRDNQRAKKPVF
jgi:hypothetical protein